MVRDWYVPSTLCIYALMWCCVDHGEYPVTMGHSGALPCAGFEIRGIGSVVRGVTGGEG